MILVVGGAGFVGSHIIAHLSAEASQPIVVCDNFGTTGQKWKNLRSHIISDFVRQEWIETWLENHAQEIEIIICTAAADDPLNPELALMTHYHLPRMLWDFSTLHDKRFLYLSSWETYGDGRFGFRDNESYENLKKLKPLSPQAWAQHNFDLYAQQQHNIGNKPKQWIGLKLFDAYGPNEYHKNPKNCSDILSIFNMLRREKEVKIPRSPRHDIPHGEYTRDRLWIGDCAAVVAWLLAEPKTSGIFNLGSGFQHSLNDLAALVASALDIPLQISYIHDSHFNKSTPAFNKAHTSKLTQEAGYPHPFTSLEDGINLYLYNYLMASSMFR
jgi:ADP-L-glycero-D-manno-heptose 6-epimerase